MDLVFRQTSTAALSSSWVNVQLYTIEVILCWYYLSKSKPNLFHRSSLLIAVTFDTVCTALNCYLVYDNLILNSGVPNSAPGPSPIAVYYLLTTLLNFGVSAIVQIFFTHRYFSISNDKIITALFATLIFLHVALGYPAAILPITNAKFDPTVQQHLATTAVSIDVAVDILIAIAMFIKLRTTQTHYLETKSRLQRISIHAVTCGFLTAITTLLELIFIFKSPTGFLATFTILGRIYTLTFIINLLLLKRMQSSQYYTGRTTTTNQSTSLSSPHVSAFRSQRTRPSGPEPDTRNSIPLTFLTARRERGSFTIPLPLDESTQTVSKSYPESDPIYSTASSGFFHKNTP